MVRLCASGEIGTLCVQGYRKCLPVKDLRRPAPPKPLVVKDLGGWRSYTVPISHIVEGVVAIVMVSVWVVHMLVVLLHILMAGCLVH